MKCPFKLFTQLLKSAFQDLETWSLVAKFAHEVFPREEYRRHQISPASHCSGRFVERTRRKSRMS